MTARFLANSIIKDFIILGKEFGVNKKAALNFSIISVNNTLSALRIAGVDIENHVYKYYEEVKRELKKQENQ
jgi:hypothetical protein